MAIASIACVAVGLWLRARGFLYDKTSFWLDECAWAMYLLEEPLRELVIRPIGFMAISKVIALLVGPGETALRTMPWLAAVATTLYAPSLARRLFSSPAARLLFVAIICLHPAAASFAKEFKPYSISLMLHVVLVLLTLSYVEGRRRATLFRLLGTAAIGTLFAQDLVFAFPGVFLVTGYAALRTKRAHVVAVVVGASVVLIALLTQYFLIWSRIPTAETSQAWGEKYDNFYVASSRSTYIEWFVERYQGLAAFPGSQAKAWNRTWLSKGEWEAARPIARSVWLVVHVAGLVSLGWYRRGREALLLVLPLLFTWLFNALGFWPFGAFRANLFMLVYVAAIAAMAFDRVKVPRSALLGLLPASILVLIPLLVFEEGWGPSKYSLTYSSRFEDVVTYLAERAPRRGKPKQVIILARGYCIPWRYYVEFHPETSRFRRKIERGFEVRCIREKTTLDEIVFEATQSETTPTWLVRQEGAQSAKLKSLIIVEKHDFGRDLVIAYTR